MGDERPATRALSTAPARPPLPFGLWVIAVALVAGGIVVILAVTGNLPPFLSGGNLGLEGSLEGRNGLGIFGAAQIVAGLGMLLRSRSAWGLAMFLVGLGLLINLVSYFRGDPNLVRLLLLVVTAFYLNQRAVRDVFADHRTATGS